jgi:hypothetical protein
MSEMCGWLCRAARPCPGVHVWRRGLSPSTPNPSLCVVKETESGEARAALTINTRALFSLCDAAGIYRTRCPAAARIASLFYKALELYRPVRRKGARSSSRCQVRPRSSRGACHGRWGLRVAFFV